MTLEEFRTLLDQALALYNSEHSGAQIDDGVTGGLGAVRYDVAQVLAEAQKEQARKNIGIDELPSAPTEPAISGQFVAIFNVTTSEEIEAAYQAGQTIAILYDNKMGYLIKRSSATDHTFAVVAPYDSDIGGIPINILSCYDNRWGRNVLEAENTANKINTITATSDGTQYPSARAVIDYVDNHRKTFEAIFDVTTSAEIEAAYQEGKTITMNNNGVIYYLRERANSQLFIFTTAPFYLDIFQEINIYTATCNNSSWSLATTKAEAVSNKVTIIDANSTNKQYPSAKAVYDYIQNNSGGGGGSGADLLNAEGIIKQQYFPEGYPYSEIGEGIVLPETTITPDENGEAALTDALGLVEGQTYTVNWNGTDYECLCGNFDLEGVLFCVLGNLGAMTGGADTGEPFIILEAPPEIAAQVGATAIVYAIDGSTTVTLSITGITEVTTPIAQKFLPKGYPYFVPGGEVVFPETTVNLPSQGEYNIPLKAGYSYTVNWNGVEYTSEASVYQTDNGPTVVIGNKELFDGSTAEIPFTIAFAPTSTFISSDEGSGTVTLSITQADSYLKMADKYIPSASKSLLVTLIGNHTGSQSEITVEKISHTFTEIMDAFRAGSMVFLEYKTGDFTDVTDVYVLTQVWNSSLFFTKTGSPNVGQVFFEQIKINDLRDFPGRGVEIYYTLTELSTNIATQLVLTSPNDKKFKVTVDDAGNLSATEVTT